MLLHLNGPYQAGNFKSITFTSVTPHSREWYCQNLTCCLQECKTETNSVQKSIFNIQRVIRPEMCNPEAPHSESILMKWYVSVHFQENQSYIQVHYGVSGSCALRLAF